MKQVSKSQENCRWQLNVFIQRFLYNLITVLLPGTSTVTVNDLLIELSHRDCMCETGHTVHACSCLCSFENHLQRLSRWLERMEVRLGTELPEGKHGDQEKASLERVEEFYQEALKERSDLIERIVGKSVVCLDAINSGCMER